MTLMERIAALSAILGCNPAFYSKRTLGMRIEICVSPYVLLYKPVLTVWK